MSVEVEVKEPELEPPVADTSSLWRNRAMELERMLQDAIEQSVDLHQEISRLSNFKESNEALQRALCGLLWEQELKMNPRGTLMRNDAYGSTEAMRIRRLKETANAELSIRDMYALVRWLTKQEKTIRRNRALDNWALMGAYIRFIHWKDRINDTCVGNVKYDARMRNLHAMWKQTCDTNQQRRIIYKAGLEKSLQTLASSAVAMSSLSQQATIIPGNKKVDKKIWKGLENNNLAAVSGKVPATLLALPGAGDPAEDLLTTLNLMDSKHWALYVLGQSAPLNSGWTLGEEVMSRLNTAVSFLPTHWLENGIGASGSTDTGPALQFNHARNVLCEVLSYVLSGQAGDGATLLGENANTPAVGGHIGSQGTSPEKKRAQKSIWEVPKTVNVMDNALHSPRTLPRSDRSVQSLFRHASRVRQISSAHWKVGQHK